MQLPFQREKLKKILKSKGKLPQPPGEEIVFDFSGNDTPKTPRGPQKPFSELTRQGKRRRIKECVSEISKAMVEVIS
jgi:hypothetical protein